MSREILDLFSHGAALGNPQPMIEAKVLFRENRRLLDVAFFQEGKESL